MNDKELIQKILINAKISIDKIDYFYQLYNKSLLDFLIKIINENKDNSQKFTDLYINLLPLRKVSNKYLLNRFQIRNLCAKVLDIELYLELSKAKINFKDPIYEREEFNLYCLKVLGIGYEPIRLYLIKKYGLIERTKDGMIYVIVENQFVTHKLKYDQNTKQEINFELEMKKILNMFDEIIIEDVLKMQEYIDLANAKLTSTYYEKFYDYVRKNYYQNGYNSYVSRKKAMLSREWSLAKLSQKINIKNENINIVLYKDIKDKDD